MKKTSGMNVFIKTVVALIQALYLTDEEAAAALILIVRRLGFSEAVKIDVVGK